MRDKGGDVGKWIKQVFGSQIAPWQDQTPMRRGAFSHALRASNLGREAPPVAAGDRGGGVPSYGRDLLAPRDSFFESMRPRPLFGGRSGAGFTAVIAPVP